MELETQKYLRSGKTIQDLEGEFAIKHGESDDGLVIFNYNQVESPKTHPITMECRGLILEKRRWDIVSMAFYRFFNHGEALDEQKGFSWRAAYAIEKLDGSLVQLFLHGGRWRMATRGVIDGKNQCHDSGMTFGQVFWRTMDKYKLDALPTDMCYAFELVSPFNRIVTLYPVPALYLLTARKRNDVFREVDREMMQSLCFASGFACPKMINVDSTADVLHSLKYVRALDEGFVVVDYSKWAKFGSYRRVKFKNLSYLQVAKMKKNSSSLSGMMGAVLSGKCDEIMSIFPEMRKHILPIKEKYEAHLAGIERDIENVRDLLGKERTKENRKEYALRVQEMTNPAVMFFIYQGKGENFEDWVKDTVEKKSLKSVCKTLMNWLNIKDAVLFDVDER